MITTDIITIGNKQFRETKSDIYMIQKVGTEEIYSSAVDVLTAEFEYVETDIELVTDEEDNNIERI